MASKTMTGARAKLYVIDPNTGRNEVVGIFNNVSYGLTYDAQPIYILGRHSPAEIVYTAQEPVRVTATGWRVVRSGAHKAAGVPNLKDLLKHEYLTLVVQDRQTEADGKNPNVATIRSVRPISYDTTIANRNPSEITCTFMGLLVDDESTENSEAPGATDLP